MEIERRQHERQKLYSPEYFDMGADNGAMIVDISEDGLGFQAVGRVEKDDQIAVSFALGTGYRISARVRVAWVGPNGNSGGTTFTELPADSRSIIREWVAKTAESAVAHEAATALESEISTHAADPNVPLVIERADGPVAPLPERLAAREPMTEAPVALEAVTQSDLSALEPLIRESVAPRFVQPDVAATTETLSPPVFRPLAPPAFPPVAPVVEESVAPPIAEPDVEPDVHSDIHSASALDSPIHSDSVERQESRVSEPEAQPQPESAPAVIQESPEELAVPDVPVLSPPSVHATETRPEIPAPEAPKISAPRTERTPAPSPTLFARAHAEESRTSFPPRHTGELFSRSPWISGQSLPEEERSHKGLIAVILLCLLGAAAIASVPYIRSHRQQIGAEIETVGKSVSGQTAQNAGQPQQAPQAPAQQAVQQNSQQSPQQSSKAPPQTAAPSPVAPSVTPVIPSDASATVTKSPATSSPPQPQSSTSTGSAPASANPNGSAAPRAGAGAGDAGVPANAGLFEFQQAQKYLNGTGGVSADPAQAAEWFWRSLEKGNTGAAVPLADLYLQGKGVSHSCLQARILLTAASHKGNATAIQKLSQLPENCEQ
ncbi:MAG TPA: PilZ domain-containing protein [Candidatus Acidoferrales bacterium]|nr:PilZ domain-containing protein [Candidatus Acidoferrales bacterium]